MVLQDGVTIAEGILVICLAVAALLIGTHLYKDEQAKKAAIRAAKEREGKLG
jgi:hypothetical protein